MRDKRAEIVGITHHVREGNFRQALQEIKAVDAIADIPSTLRVL
jgi:homoserine dehydrogenase